MKFSSLIRAACPAYLPPLDLVILKILLKSVGYEASHCVNMCDSVELLISFTEYVVVFIYNTLRCLKKITGTI